VQIINLIILFILNRYQRLLLCFLDAIIQSSVGSIAANLADVSLVINSQLSAIQGQVNTNVAIVNRELAEIGQDANGAINIINAIFTGEQAGPGISLPPIPDIGSIEIPQEVINSLNSLTLPTLDEVEAEVGRIVSVPFDFIENGIRDTFTELSESVNITLIAPLRSEAPPLTFCQEKFDLGFIDDTIDASTTALYIAIGIMLLVALILTIANAIWIKRNHVRDEVRVQELEEKIDHSLVDGAGNQELARDLVAQAASPRLFSATQKSGLGMFKSSETRQRKWKWFMNYANHSPSLQIVAFGLTGVILIYVTLLTIDLFTASLLPSFAENVLAATDELVNFLAGTGIFLFDLTQKVNDAIAPFADQVNIRVDIVENQINLGIETLVDETSVVLNSTVGVFIRGFQSELAQALAPVPALALAIENFGNCVLNLDQILESLDAVKDLLRIELLRVDLDLLKIDDLSVSIREAINEGQEDVFGAQKTLADFVLEQLDRIVDQGKDSLSGQLWNFWFALAFGLLVTVSGLVSLIWI
jgi:hypothetical protein